MTVATPLREWPARHEGKSAMTVLTWTDDRVEQLKKLWEGGLSASQIAAELGNVTRNAVIGKVHRLGLAGRAKSPSSAASRPPRRMAPPPAHRVAGPRLAPAPRMTRGATALAYAPQALSELETQEEFESVVVPMSLRVTIIELKESMCRWPLGDPANSEFPYCGSPTASGPYCGYHGGLAYQPPQDRRRDRSRRTLLR